MGCGRRGMQASRRVCQANGYTPRMDPTLDMWYSADYGATVVGGKVSRFEERTGRAGFALVQGSGANRGTLKTDARYGGRTVLDMTGSVYMTGNPPGRDQPYAYYIVGNVANTTTQHYLLGSTGGALGLVQLASNGGVLLNATVSLTAPGNASTPGIYIAVTNGVSSAIHLRTLSATVSGNAGGGAVKTGALYLGSTAVPSLFLGDAWAELIGCCSANINPLIMQYLARKYAIALS